MALVYERGAVYSVADTCVVNGGQGGQKDMAPAAFSFESHFVLGGLMALQSLEAVRAPLS